MKSIMKKSLAVVMVLSMLLSFALPTFAVSAHTHEGDNTPCDCGAPVETEVVEATCMEHGGTWNTCTVCGDTWVTNETPKLPYNDPKSHKLSTEAVAKDATCWAPGHTAAKACTVKGCTYQEGGEVIPQFTHGDPETDPLSSLVIDEQTLTSCLEGGVITYKCQFADVEGSQCPGYNGEFDEEYKADGHKHELRATGYQAPTCDAKGWVTIDCTVCADTFKVAIAAKQHVWTEVVGEPAVCYEKGYYAGFYCAHEWLVWDENGNATKQSCSAYYITEEGHEDGTAANPLFTETDLNKEALAIPATNTHKPVKVTEEMFGEELAFQQPMCGANAQPGWQWWVCAEADCDWSEKRTLQPEHKDNGRINTVVAPNCTETGYTLHECGICGENYKVDETPIKHAWVSSSADGKVVYTFVKDGKVYVNDGDLRDFDGNNMDLVINYIPYMVPAAELLSDATAQKLMADGYTEMAWTVMTAVKCGTEGVYAHKCSKCPAKGFLTINVDHVWDRDLKDLEKLIPATCTEPGGYIGTCTICTEEFILSAAMVGELDPDYTGESAPTGHQSNNGYVLAKDPVTGKFLFPTEQAVPATCIAEGREGFYYCNNENCPEKLSNYETALAAAKSIDKVAHQYYDADGNAYKTERVPVSCMYPSYLIAKCNTCDLRIDEDAVAANGKTSWELRIANSEEGEYDGVSHVYPAFGEEGRPVAKQPTCAKAGRYADVQCTLCPYVDIGVEIPALNPGEVPTYNADMEDGDVIEGVTGQGWLITITAPTCTKPGKVEASCLDCNGTTHATTTIHTFEKTGIHFIAGATYIKNANGEYMTVKGAYVVDRATLTGAVASCTAPDCATTHIANAGGCDEKVNDLHADHYYCADCGEVIFFAVRFDHIAGKTECGKPTTCTECKKVLVEAEPHIMEKIEGELPVGDDNDCSTEFYYHIECTRPGCDFDSKSADFEWTDEWKAIAEYVAAQEHDYNGMEEATCEKAMECVREGCDHVEEAAKDHDLVMGYQDPTCITLGYNIFRCKAAEKCDKAGAVIVEIDGVKYAEWRELDATSNYADHDYDVDNDGDDDVYLARVGNCLTYNVVVYRCESCYGTATVDENGFISHGYVVEDFADPTGHKLVEHNTIEDCSNGGVYWSYCEYCFDETKYNAGENGLWNEVDYKGDKGYTEKEYKDPTGHWFWTTPAADATQEEIDAFVAEKVFFKLTCQDAIKYNNPTCADCGETATPDMHILSKAYYEKETTCTENGLKWHSCTVEGCTYRSILEVELAFGHAAPYWKDVTPATCCAPGTAILACRVCDAAIAEGDLVTAPTEDPTNLVSDDTFVAYNATADQLTKELDQLDHDFVNGTVISDDPATIHTPGKKVVQCALFCGVDADGNPVQCPVTDTITSGKLDHIEFSATIDNVVKPGHLVFVNGGKIAYTIFIDGEEKDVYGLNFNVVYDADALTFTGFDLGEDGENIFGTLDESGACNTWVGGTKSGVVSVLASASPNADGTIGYVTVNEKQEFVTLYFDINADTVTDDPFDVGYFTEITIEGVVLEGISIGGDTTTPEIVFGNDFDHVVVDADEIRVEKLGDVNVVKDAEGNMLLSDKILNVRDVNAIEKLILAGEYDARADINQDGNITAADMIAVQKYIINAYTYAEMVGVVEE